MTKTQRANVESQDHYADDFPQLTVTGSMMVMSMSVPEIDGTDLAVFERSVEVVNGAVYELLRAICGVEWDEIEDELQRLAASIKIAKKARKMTEKDHEAMQAKLLRRAKAGNPRPEWHTLEAVCLRAYIDDGRIAGPAMVAAGVAPPTARQGAR